MVVAVDVLSCVTSFAIHNGPVIVVVLTDTLHNIFLFIAILIKDDIRWLSERPRLQLRELSQGLRHLG